MNRSKTVKVNIFLATFCLVCGVVNYYLFRPDIALFRFLDIVNPGLKLNNVYCRIFFTNYFSDITWCLALCFTVELLSSLGLLHTPAKVLILVLPFELEIGQYFNIIPGTFDWIDLGIYAVIIFIFSLRLFKIPRS